MVFSVISGLVAALGTAVVIGLNFGLPRVFGRSGAHYRPRVHLSAGGPEGLRVQDPDGREKDITMRSLIEEKCPSLFREFRPARWLFRYAAESCALPACRTKKKLLASGHLQTAYSVVGDFSKVDKVEYDR